MVYCCFCQTIYPEILQERICHRCINSSTENHLNPNKKLSPIFQQIIQDTFGYFTANNVFKNTLGSYPFLQKIDADLLPRFVSMLPGIEKYLFVFSSKKASQLLELKPLIISNNLFLNGTDYLLPNFDAIIVTEKISFQSIDFRIRASQFLVQHLHNSFISKKLILYAKNIEFIDCTNLLDDFFNLLSPRITEFKCNFCTFNSSIKFSSFIKKLPNLETLLINDTNIEFDNLWIKNLLKFCKKIKYFEIFVKNIKLLSLDCLEIYQTRNPPKNLCSVIDVTPVMAELRKKLINYEITVKQNQKFGLCVYAKKV